MHPLPGEQLEDLVRLLLLGMQRGEVAVQIVREVERANELRYLDAGEAEEDACEAGFTNAPRVFSAKTLEHARLELRPTRRRLDSSNCFAHTRLNLNALKRSIAQKQHAIDCILLNRSQRESFSFGGVARLAVHDYVSATLGSPLPASSHG